MEGSATVVRGDLRPSTKQVYLICRLLCEKHGYDFPSDRQGASDMIGQLKGKSS